MKKILAMGVAALSLVMISEQQASAWVNWKFGAGINFNYQSGGNNCLWGAFRNGQPPAPDCGPGCPPGCPPGGAPGCGPRGGYPGFPPYGPGEFQYFGAQRPQGGDVGQLPPTTPTTSGYGAYRPVSYTPSAAYSYYYPSYYTPSYWYGR